MALKRGQYILLQGLDREFRILTDEVAELKLLTYQKMMDKFGMVVDIDEMHRTLLESLFYKMTVDDVAIQKDFQKRNTLVKVPLCNCSDLFFSKTIVVFATLILQ